MPNNIPGLDRPISSTNDSVILAFDIGGSHISAMAVRRSSPLHGIRMSVALDESGSKAYLFDRIVEAGRMALAPLNSPENLAGIAVAIPGPFDYPNGVSLLQHKLSAWYGVNLRKQLAVRFEIDEVDIVFLNDADAFLLGELQGTSASRAIGITLGTGVGAAFAVEGRTVPASEILPYHRDLYGLPWKNGIVDEFISSRGIMRLHEDRNGQCRSVKEIAAKSSVDPTAAKTMLAFGIELAFVIETYLLPFAPDAIILGGSIALSSETFLPGTVSDTSVLTSLLKISRHFENAALFGSIADWCRQRNRH